MTTKTKPVLEADGKTRMESREVDFRSKEVADQPGPYIPGYSEQVRANDIAKGEEFASAGKIYGLSESDKREYYERFGCEPKPLPYVFQYLRVATSEGKDAGQTQTIRYNLARRRRDGWTLAKEEDFEEGGKFHNLGWGMPPDVDVMGDGTLRRWDTALFYIDGDKYRRMKEDSHSEHSARDTLRGIPESHRVYEEEEGTSAVFVPDGSL